MIEIRTLNAADLEALVRSPEYAAWPNLPISVHRGISHAHNPRAEKDDVLLLLAYEGEAMVGYLGVLPDRLYLGQEREKAAWLSCIWVDPAQRGKGISKKLTRKALEIYAQRILITEFTGPAGRLYEKLDAFVHLQIKAGWRIYRRLDLANVLGKRGGIWSKLKGLLKVTDVVGNALLDLRFLLMKEGRGEWQLEEVSAVDAEMAAWIAEVRREDELFRRGADELNWMLQYPWMLASEPDEMSRKYAFSSVASHFSNHVIRVSDTDGKLRMALFFQRRDGQLKLNHFFAEAGLEGEALRLLRHFMRKWKVPTLLIYQERLVAEISKAKMGALHRRPAKREYRIGKVFAGQIEGREVAIQDGDGDCGFT